MQYKTLRTDHTMLSCGMFGRSIANVMQFSITKTSTTLSKDSHAINRQHSCLNLHYQCPYSRLTVNCNIKIKFKKTI